MNWVLTMGAKSGGDDQPDAATGPAATAAGHSAGTPPEQSGIDHDELFEVLSNQRRRFAIHYLKQRPDERVEMGELSRQVAAWELEVDPEQLSYEDRKTVHTALYQHHAPKLDEAGMVEYDASRGEVGLTETGETMDLYLEAVTGQELPWAAYFTLLSVVGVLTAVAAWLGALPMVLPTAGWGGVIAVGFLVSSLVFAYDTRDAMQLGTSGPPPEVRSRHR
jgi:hypothetical protein